MTNNYRILRRKYPGAYKLYKSTKYFIKSFVKNDNKDKFPECFDKHKCIFIHIPKTAGISVSLALFNQQVGHKPYIDYYYDSIEKTNIYFKFCFVRNPWSRIYSAYQYLQGGGMNADDKQWYENNIQKYGNFNDFVKYWLNKDVIFSSVHLIPQYDFITDEFGEVKMDFIGKVENLENDFAYVANKLGVPESRLSHENKSAGEYYREIYTKESIEKVFAIYNRDITLFNYEF